MNACYEIFSYEGGHLSAVAIQSHGHTIANDLDGVDAHGAIKFLVQV